MASLINQAGAVGGGGGGEGGGGEGGGFRVVCAEGDLARAGLTRMIDLQEEVSADLHDVAEGLTPSAFDHLIGGEGGPSRLWIAVKENGVIGEVGQVVPSSGRTAGVYLAPSRDGTRLARAQRVAILKAACAALAKGVYGPTALVQGLLEQSERDLAAAYVEAGFIRLADLGYYRREISRFARYDAPVWPAGVRVVRLSEMPWDTGQSLLLRAMEATYVGTQDCPALCGLRTVDDVLASHKSVGTFDPALWWLVTVGGDPQGCMLLSRYPAHESVELVYLGLGPAARGKGIGQGLISLALGELQSLGEQCVACAVDMANGPALRLYKSARFKEFARRTALIMDLTGGVK